MMRFELTYVSLIREALEQGKVSEGRNGTTTSVFGKTLTIDMSKSADRFPLLLGRKMYYKGVLGELTAFLRGASSVEEFEQAGCNYWKQWADENGHLELDYGTSWTDYNGANQLANVITQLKECPNSRRIMMNSWRPDRVINHELSLPCCHYAYQWYVTEDGYLDMIWIQRSVDLMIGLPSDIILAAAMNVLLAQLTYYKPGKITMQLGDCHVYSEHYQGALTYLNRMRSAQFFSTDYPMYSIEKRLTNYQSFDRSSITISSYEPHLPINFELKA